MRKRSEFCHGLRICVVAALMFSVSCPAKPSKDAVDAKSAKQSVSAKEPDAKQPSEPPPTGEPEESAHKERPDASTTSANASENPAVQLRPSVQDYLNGRAGTEVLVSPSGYVMPRGWPVPGLFPPADAKALAEASELAKYGAGAVSWGIEFTTDSDWSSMAEEAEQALGAEGFKRVVGKRKEEPQLDEQGKPTVGRTVGRRTYRSEDGYIAVMLRAVYQKVPSAPRGPTTTVEMRIIYFDTPTPVSPDAELHKL